LEELGDFKLDQRKIADRFKLGVTILWGHELCERMYKMDSSSVEGYAEDEAVEFEFTA
jgi:hypothetical protein